MIEYVYDSLRVLTEVFGNGAYLSQALSAVDIEEANRPQTTKICYGVVERNAELEYIIGKLCQKSPKAVVRNLLKISIYLLRYMEKPPYAVTHSAVELLKKMGKGGMGGFVNAVLRNYVKGVEMPTDKRQARALRLNAPQFAIDRITKEYGEETADDILTPRKGNTFVRFEKDGEAYLTTLGVTYQNTPFQNLFCVPNFHRNADYDQGVYTFQQIGSVAVCDVVKGGKTLLDCCAAPGGKSVLLADKFESVTATELHPHRAELIQQYAQRMHKENVAVLTHDWSNDATQLGVFDAVLCDVPCSGYGVLADHPDIRLFRTEQNLKELVAEQKKILRNAKNHVKVGGVLYYSTCSVFPEENRMQADAFLKENPEFSAVELDSPLSHQKSGVGLQFLPHVSLGAGFYVAAFRRNQ